MQYPELCSRPTLAFPDLVRRAVAEGAWVHTPSRFVADEVIADLDVDPDRVRAVHLRGAADSPSRRRGRPALPPALPAGCSRYILAVGTIEPRKDYPLLLSAFTALADDIPMSPWSSWAATGGAWSSLPPRWSRRRSGRRIVRPGYVDDGGLADLLRGAAVLAYPSVYEGFGFPPLQAMADGGPGGDHPGGIDPRGGGGRRAAGGAG